MSINKKDIINIINDFLIPHSFKRNSELWYLESSECYSMLELEKSSWGGQFSIMLNVIVKELNPNIRKPKSIYGGFGGWSLDWLVQNKEEFNNYLDLELDYLSLEGRRKAIGDALVNCGIPFLMQINTTKGLKQVLIKNKRLRYHTINKLWQHLNLDIEKEPPLPRAISDIGIRKN